MPECPKCKSTKVVSGRLTLQGHSGPRPIAFAPSALKWYQFSLDGGAELQTEAFACPDCAMVWTMAAYPETLREIIKQFERPK
jgi:hypothetical protein